MCSAHGCHCLPLRSQQLSEHFEMSSSPAEEMGASLLKGGSYKKPCSQMSFVGPEKLWGGTEHSKTGQGKVGQEDIPTCLPLVKNHGFGG